MSFLRGIPNFPWFVKQNNKPKDENDCSNSKIIKVDWNLKKHFLKEEEQKKYQVINEKQVKDKYALIREVIGNNHPIAVGWTLIVQIFTDGDNHLRDDGTSSNWERPDDTKEGDAYRRGTGRLLLKGSAAFKDHRFKDWDTIPEVGDWIDFARNSGTYRQYNQVYTLLMKDVEILTIASDPAIESYHVHIGN